MLMHADAKAAKAEAMSANGGRNMSTYSKPKAIKEEVIVIPAREGKKKSIHVTKKKEQCL